MEEVTAALSGDARQSGYVRTALEATNAQLKARVRELSDDLEFLRAARGKVSSDTAQFVAYATNELRAKDDLISELRAQLREISYSKDIEARKVRAQMESAFEEAVSEAPPGRSAIERSTARRRVPSSACAAVP